MDDEVFLDTAYAIALANTRDQLHGKIIPLTDALYAQALALYRSRLDKEWGLIDCLSFVVMRERRLTVALTADQHFQQAGFQASLRE